MDVEYYYKSLHILRPRSILPPLAGEGADGGNGIAGRRMGGREK